MYRLAKTDRRANSSFKKKNIYIYYLIYIYIFIYKYSPGRARVCSFFFWRTLYIFLFHSLARSVFDWLRFQSGSLWDSSFSNFCLWYIRCLDTTRTLISLHHFVSLFFFLHFILSKEKWESSCDSRSFPLSTSLTSYLAVIRCRFYSFTPWSRNIRRNVLELRFKRSDTGFGIGSSIRQSTRSTWPDDGSETGSSDVLQDPWNELGDPRAHPW